VSKLLNYIVNVNTVVQIVKLHKQRGVQSGLSNTQWLKAQTRLVAACSCLIIIKLFS